MNNWPKPTSKYPDGVLLIGGPDHGKVANFGGYQIEPSRVIERSGRIRPAADGVYEYRYFTDGLRRGLSYIGVWAPEMEGA
jgi:hypothetical protein